MIHITVEKQEEVYCRIVSKGHAFYYEYDEDIVCAAVSALLINTANSIEQLTEDGLTIEEGGEEGGYLSIALEQPQSPEAKLLLDSLMLGLQSIKEQYTKTYLVLETRNVRAD